MGPTSDQVAAAFGPRPPLPPSVVANIFCPTGQGGGIDPTCGGGRTGGRAAAGSRPPGGSGGMAGVPPGTYGTAAPPRRGRQLAPATPEGARKRFEEVARAVFGKGGKRAEDGAIVYTMPGGRFISVKLQATVVARHGSHVVLRYDARVDFGVEGRSATSVAPRLERESVATLRKVKEAAQAYHQAGFSLEVQPSDSRRREAYGKILTGMGLKLQQSGEVEVWNGLALAVANIFCPTGAGGGIDPTCGAGKGGNGGAGRGPRQPPPSNPAEAVTRFSEVAKKVFGREATGGYITQDLPGGRQIMVMMKMNPELDGGQVKINYDARIDFSVIGRDHTSVGKSVERESLEMVRKVKAAAKAFHDAGFRLEVVGADERRQKVYDKALRGAGIEPAGKTLSGDQVYNFSGGG